MFRFSQERGLPIATSAKAPSSVRSAKETNPTPISRNPNLVFGERLAARVSLLGGRRPNNLLQRNFLLGNVKWSGFHGIVEGVVC